MSTDTNVKVTSTPDTESSVVKVANTSPDPQRIVCVSPASTFSLLAMDCGQSE
jgi:hypothetical protein